MKKQYLKTSQVFQVKHADSRSSGIPKQDKCNKTYTQIYYNKNPENKEILQATKEREHTPHRKTMIQMTMGFSLETMEARSSGTTYLKC